MIGITGMLFKEPGIVFKWRATTEKAIQIQFSFQNGSSYGVLKRVEEATKGSEQTKRERSAVKKEMICIVRKQALLTTLESNK